MVKAGKLLIHDVASDSFFVLYRANHPYFGNSIDLPGGIFHRGEAPIEALLREVKEETGANISIDSLQLVYQGKTPPIMGNEYFLYYTQIEARMPVVLSWEHESYDWISKDALIKQSLASNDDYMTMVASEIINI